MGLFPIICKICLPELSDLWNFAVLAPKESILAMYVCRYSSSRALPSSGSTLLHMVDTKKTFGAALAPHIPSRIENRSRAGASHPGVGDPMEVQDCVKEPPVSVTIREVVANVAEYIHVRAAGIVKARRIHEVVRPASHGQLELLSVVGHYPLGLESDL